jgi:hypothetical protein
MEMWAIVEQHIDYADNEENAVDVLAICQTYGEARSFTLKRLATARTEATDEYCCDLCNELGCKEKALEELKKGPGSIAMIGIDKEIARLTATAAPEEDRRSNRYLESGFGTDYRVFLHITSPTY